MPFQPWLRGSIDGITPEQAARLFNLRDRLRRGVLTHVALHARLERRYERREGGEVKEELREGQLQAGADPGERAAPAQAGRPASLEGRRHRLDRLPAARTPTATTTPSARPPSSARRLPRPAPAAGLGHGLQRRRLLADRRRAGRERGRLRLRPRDGGGALPLAARRGRPPHPAAGRRPRRPLTGAGLARARAAAAGGAGHARPGAGAGARPPRLDHRQRAPGRVPRLAAGARLGTS